MVGFNLLGTKLFFFDIVRTVTIELLNWKKNIFRSTFKYLTHEWLPLPQICFYSTLTSFKAQQILTALTLNGKAENLRNCFTKCVLAEISFLFSKIFLGNGKMEKQHITKKNVKKCRGWWTFDKIIAFEKSYQVSAATDENKLITRKRDFFTLFWQKMSSP